ncbi:MAG TPA: hypothetical protein VFP71_07920 [Candidatus Angelobacter sp.]|nr:hypothetical protein [Candidatus Angelobacter sp.]
MERKPLMAVQSHCADQVCRVLVGQKYLMAVQTHYADQVFRARVGHPNLEFPIHENNCVPDAAGRRKKGGSAAR